MTVHRNAIVAIAMFAAALALSGCGKQPPPPAPAPAAPAPSAATTPAAPPATPAPATPSTTVTAIAVGNALDAQGKVAPGNGTFAPKDTIYAQVTTNSTGGAGSASITAKWTYGDGQSVSENTESVSTAAGSATTTFHVSKPDGWPAGKYKVDISVDGKPATSATFEVK